MTKSTLDQDIKMLIGTLIEEYLHLRYSFYNCSCAMQNFLLNRIVSLGEEIVGERF